MLLEQVGRQTTQTQVFMRLLGPCALELRGTPVAIGGPRPQAVLLRLALAGGHLVTADRLIEDLWGDDPPASVVTTLQGYVSRLRSALGDASRLRREGPGYVLDLGPDEVDCRRFEALVDEAGSRADDPERVVQLLDDALDLWRGSALVDVADTEWARPSAVRLEERRLEAIECRFDAQLALGRHAAVVPQIEQTVNDHPYRERFAAQLMTALYRCGRQADALRVYERVRRTLLDEAGLHPSHELVVLESAILAQDPALAAPVLDRPPSGGGSGTPRRRATDRVADGESSSGESSREESSSGESVPADLSAEGEVPDRPEVPTPTEARAQGTPVTTIEFPPLPPAAQRQATLPFVGRASALAAVDAAWDAAVDGQRSFVVLEGEAGAGKSRLAARFAAHVHDGGGIVMWGRWTEESILPYGPIVEAVRTALLDASPAMRDLVLGLPGLRPLRPFIDAGDHPDIPSAVAADVGLDRHQLFEGVAEMVHTESQNAPILFVLDDLQWSDQSTLRLLLHLLQHQRPARILFLATARTVPTTANAALDAFLGDVRRDHLLQKISLDGLAHHEVAELLRRDGADVPRERVDHVLDATRGNPFFVMELAQHGSGSAVPDSVRDVIGARLARLGADASRLLSTAAVAGTAAPLDVLADASGLAGGALLDALDEAIEAGLLVEDAADTVLFRHALVQQVVHGRLGKLRRRVIHSAVAEAYEAQGGRAIDVAHHLLEAGSLVAPERAAMAAVAAGREALSVYAYETTVDWTSRALAVEGVEDQTVCGEALVTLSAAHRALGDGDAARACAIDATEAARSAGDPLLLAVAAESLMLARAGLGFDFGAADHELRTLLAEALHGLTGEPGSSPPALSPSDPVERGPSGSQWLPQDALARAEAEGHHALVATAHLTVRMSIWRVDALEQRLDADHRGLAAAERSNQPALLLNSLLYLVTDLTEAGRVAEANAQFERIREVAGQVRQPAYDAFVDFFDAQQALGRGDYERSADLADRARTTGRQSHGVNAELAWAGQLFIRAWDQGRIGEMVDLFDETITQSVRATIFGAARSLSLVAAGREEEVRASLDDHVHERWLAVDRDSVWLAMGGLLAEIIRALDEPGHAEVVAENLRPYSGRIAVTGLGRASLGPVDRFIGVALGVAGDVDGAVGHLEAAAALARQSGATAHEARALHDLGSVLERSDDPGLVERGAQVTAEAFAMADPLGLHLRPIGAPMP